MFVISNNNSNLFVLSASILTTPEVILLLANGIDKQGYYCIVHMKDKTRQDRIERRNKIPRTIYSHILECKG